MHFVWTELCFTVYLQEDEIQEEKHKKQYLPLYPQNVDQFYVQKAKKTTSPNPSI